MEKDYNDYQSKRDDTIKDYHATDRKAELEKLKGNYYSTVKAYDDQARRLMPNIAYIEIDSSACKSRF